MDRRPTNGIEQGIISDIAADKAGNIYVLRGREVLTFPAGSKGDVLPASIIAGPATDLLGARNIAVTPDGSRIFIVSACGPENNACILSFPSNANGNIRPDSEISFSRGYGCGMYGALRLDPKGNVWVSDALNNCLSEVSANSSGAVEPTTTIWGSSTGLAGPNGFAFDQRGTLYVANRRSRSITVYQAGTREDASPIATIFGPRTKLMDPWSVAVDQRGTLYIAGGERLLQFNDRDAGDVMPKRESKLSNTGPSPTIVILD